MNFSGKRVLVTGASRGIGLAIAQQFKSLGAYVAGTATSETSVTHSECDEMLYVDFSDEEQLERCVEFVCRYRPDILINNAGINKIAPFSKIDPEDFKKIQQVNVFAPFRLCQASLPFMQEKKWGRIVNISSIWGKISKEFRASYSASKFAIDGMTIALSAELASHNILANCVAPGFTDTELTRQVLGRQQIDALVQQVPIQKLATVADVAKFVCWLSSEDNSYITGQNIAIDGGFSRA